MSNKIKISKNDWNTKKSRTWQTFQWGNNEHKSSVLEMEESQIVEYLKYAIDTFYKTEEDGDNPEVIDQFFDTKEFKPYYDLILNTDEEAATEEEE